MAARQRKQKNINFDVFLRLLAEFALAGLVGQVGSPWLRGVPFFETLGLRRPPFLVHFRVPGAPKASIFGPFLGSRCVPARLGRPVGGRRWLGEITLAAF